MIRSWLILKVKGTNKVVVLKRSKSSRNSGQWDFIGGSSKRRRANPRKLIRKESIEEIGFTLPFITNRLIIVSKYSTYYYFVSRITKKELAHLRLSHEHSRYKLIDINKLRYQRSLHHSIKLFLKY